MWLLKTEPSTYGYDDLERDEARDLGRGEEPGGPARTCGR